MICEHILLFLYKKMENLENQGRSKNKIQYNETIVVVSVFGFLFVLGLIYTLNILNLI